MKILLFLSLICPLMSFAETAENPLIRRITVFPIKTPAAYSESAEDAWWQVRDILTQNRRFLVASKNFLQRKDVYQSRGELKPADAIILAELLDAQVIITSFLKDRVLHMQAYSGEMGRLLWRQEIKLHPSLPIAQQLADSGKKLIKDFIAAVPYQGFVVTDKLIGTPYFKQDDKIFVKVNVGTDSKAEAGDQLQLIKVVSDNFQPTFMDGSHIEVYAEGKIIEKRGDHFIAEILRATSLKDIQEGSIVRLPKEHKRLKEMFSFRDSLKRRINPEYYSPTISSLDQEVKENKPLAATMSFVLNLAAFLLLAF